MIIVTGAAGFIGSCLVGKLNMEGYNDIVLVDDFSNEAKTENYANKNFSLKVDRSEFHDWLANNHVKVQFIFHIGARTDTTEFDVEIFNRLNLNYTQKLWNMCVEYGLPVVYASSAATYGLGENGYNDDHDIVDKLRPLNPYGDSKNDFDKWALSQDKKPYFWAGLKFFNVYGPNEYHKDRMASVIYHAYRQVKEKGTVTLFRSHNKDYEDGQQLRDFVYVKDTVEVCYFLMHNRKFSGLYNLGTGNARSFYDLASTTIKYTSDNAEIQFIDTPEDIRDKYQYFTEANMSKLKSIGYDKSFYTLEDGIEDYVRNYLEKNAYL